MQESPKYQASPLDGSLRQGEIVSDLIQIKLNVATIGAEQPEIYPQRHPFAIVISQDCDLDWDHRAREGETEGHKKIPNILFCEVDTAENLSDLIRTIDDAKNVNKSRTWGRVKINKEERYHFLEKVDPEQDQLGEGLPELGVDFKRYFTIPADEVYHRLDNGEAKRRCYLTNPYLQHFSTRFFYFQFRIALPEEHYSEPNN